MWNPFARREVRASYTDALVSLLVREASGSGAPTGQAHATAAVESCAALWSHAFAGARLEPEVPALSPPVLADIARRLILDGEALFVIEVGAGGLKLLPVGSHDVTGTTPDPDTWLYRCDLHGPNGSTTRTVPAAGVVHVRYSVDPSRPHRGVGPLRRAALDADLLSAIVTRLGEESGAPVAHVIPSPVDGAADSTATLRADLKAARGGVVLAETQMGGYGDKAGAPMSDFAVKRIGANPPDVLRALASETGERIMEACGMPSPRFWSLIRGRDSRGVKLLRRVGRTVTCAPLGRIVVAELSTISSTCRDSLWDFAPLYWLRPGGSRRKCLQSAWLRPGWPAEKAFALSGLVAGG